LQREARKYLYDMQQAAALIAEFTDGRDFHSYVADRMLRAAVEREFTIIGEALGRLAKLDPVLVARVSECHRIIAFRNVLVHGYASVNDRLVWGVVETSLPVLRQEVEQLLGEL
jgi:uncharacterized protein with HEPN domain